MAQARTRSDPEVSLFPFLSILVCLIGALVVLIVILTVVQSSMADGRSLEEVVRAREADRLRREMAKRDKAHTDIKSLVDPAQRLAQELKEKNERFVLLRKNLNTSAAEKKKIEETNAELQKQLENLLLQLEAMAREAPPIKAGIEKLKAELAARKKNIDAKPRVVVQPTGGGVAGDAQLHFVECGAAGIVIHQPGAAPQRITSASIGVDAAYDGWLQKVAADPRSLILFLMREDGLGAYNRAAGWAENKFNVRTGKVPLVGQGEVDLSRFQQPKPQ
jgi:hypothetical protein